MILLKRFFCLIFFAGSMFSCSTTGTYIPNKHVPAKGENCTLEIFMPGIQIDKEFELVGTFSVQEKGLSIDCGWEETLEKNKKYACSSGAEAIQFLSIDTPSIISTCYTSKANFIIFKK